MKFSIVTCTWNSESWIGECLSSITQQDYPEIEQVFVDGGSTDGTLERIKAVKGDVTILEGVRGGISHAMNEGVRAARGDVVAHLHSDDFYVAPDVLSRVATAFRTRDADWLYGRCMSVVDGVLTENDFVTKPYSWHALIRNNIVPHPATFMRRSTFLDLGGFDPGYRYAMDYDLWLRAARIGAPIQLSDYLAAFRFHAGSLSTVNARAGHREALSVRLRHAGTGSLERVEHLARYGVRMAKLSMRSQARGGFRA